MQKYKSDKTSINVVNKVYKKYKFENDTSVLDYGGGKYDTNKEYMKDVGVDVEVFDPYNRTEQHNKSVLEKFKNEKPDYIVCSNVLNVIKEDEVIDDVLKNISKYNTTSLFAIYEGDKSGVGKLTTKGWQRNSRTKDYLPFIMQYFEVTNIKNGIIECRNKN